MLDDLLLAYHDLKDLYDDDVESIETTIDDVESIKTIDYTGSSSSSSSISRSRSNSKRLDHASLKNLMIGLESPSLFSPRAIMLKNEVFLLSLIHI